MDGGVGRSRFILNMAYFAFVTHRCCTCQYFNADTLSMANHVPIRIVSHSRFVQDIARQFGWMAGARYTNLRDIKHLNEVYFIDIDWKNYDFERHLHAVRIHRPALTVARDVICSNDLDSIVREAELLNQHANKIIIVPKDRALESEARLGVPIMFRLGYSIPTKYGGTEIPVEKFTGPVHLLGGRPDVQRQLAEKMNVVSLDGNRITLDAKFGDVFIGDRFRPHPVGGYETCLRESFRRVNELWMDQ